MILTCGQFSPHAADVAANAAIMVEQIAEAAVAGARLIVFPELCLSGYLTPEEIAPLAVNLDGPEVAPLREAAHRQGIAVAFGLAERAPDGAVYNSMAYLDGTGAIGAVYHKVHLWDSEKRWARPGEGFATFDAAGARAGMWICYDTRFPECARSLAVQGAALGLVATAWLGPAEEWKLAVRARAMDNGMYVAASALQGRHGPFVFNGGSLIVDPHGKVLAEAEEGTDEVIAAEYDERVLAGFCGRVPLLEHRRLDAYADLLRPASW